MLSSLHPQPARACVLTPVSRCCSVLASQGALSCHTPVASLPPIRSLSGPLCQLSLCASPAPWPKWDARDQEVRLPSCSVESPASWPSFLQPRKSHDFESRIENTSEQRQFLLHRSWVCRAFSYHSGYLGMPVGSLAWVQEPGGSSAVSKSMAAELLAPCLA